MERTQNIKKEEGGEVGKEPRRDRSTFGKVKEERVEKRVKDEE